MTRAASSPGEPVFLLGFARSGTTLLRLFLDAHPQLAIPFESFVLVELWRRQAEYGDLAIRGNRERLVHDLLVSKGISAWRPRVQQSDVDLDRCTTFAATVEQVFGAYARHCGKPRWGDKTPSYTCEMHVLNEWFPQARFVHLVRDGRDVALSVVRQPWGAGDFLSALRQWNEVVGWSRKMGRMLPPERYLEIRYEDLVWDTEAILRRITEFLNLPFEPLILQTQAHVEDKLPSRSMAFHANLTRPVDRGLARQWTRALSASDQALALRVAGPLLQELGYPAETPRVAYARIQGRAVWHAVSAAARWRLRRLAKVRRKFTRRSTTGDTL